MKKIIAAVLFLFVFIPNSSAVKAATTATTILSGGTSLTGDYDIYKTDADTTEDWNSTANVFLSLIHSRLGEKGGLSLSYGANYSYEFSDEESTFSDQRFTLNGWRNLSKRLRFNISDTFIMTNDLWAEWLSPTATGISDDPLEEKDKDTPGDTSAQDDLSFSSKIGQEKFWSNYFSTGFDYDYAQNSTITIGYNNRILEYDEPHKDNYMYNEPWANLSYWFNPQWNTSLSYYYTDAQFDITEDFTTNDASFNLNYVHSVQDTFFGGLKYYDKNYDTITLDILEDPEVIETTFARSDYYGVRANLGWTHSFSPQKSLSMSAGPEYVKKEDEDDYTTVFFDINYNNRFQNGSWFIRADGGFDDRSFDGAFNEGISEFQRVSGGVSWQAAKNLSADLSAYIRTDGFLENPLESDEKTYNATAGLSYRFSRWFYVSGRYWYTKVDADLNIDDYDEHRFFITLGASKELYRWIH